MRQSRKKRKGRPKKSQGKRRGEANKSGKRREKRERERVTRGTLVCTLFVSLL